MLLRSPEIELRPRLRAVGGQRAFLADGVRPLEDPVLPGGQPAEDFVSIVSGPANRRLASMPVSASGDNAARLSMASRTSSSQSSSSGANETSPASAAAARVERLRRRPSSSATRSGSPEEPRLEPRQAVAHLQRPAFIGDSAIVFGRSGSSSM